MLSYTRVIAALCIAFESPFGQAQITGAKQNPVTAIDILLEPDTTMLKHAEAVNARLLKVFPKGFALDATHRPHITIVQRFVRTADLDKVYDVVGKAFAGANVTGIELEALTTTTSQIRSLASLASSRSRLLNCSSCSTT